MSVKGEVRKQGTGDFKKYVGLGLIDIVAINPTREEINKLFETDGEKTDEIVYLSEDKDGNKRLKLTFIVKEDRTGKMFYHNIFLIDKPKIAKLTGNQQWINSALDTCHVDDEENLPSWFKNFEVKDKTTGEKTTLGEKSWRKAIVGEEALANFVKGWHGNLDFYKPTAEILIDKKKLFKENYRELKEMMGSEWVAPFVSLFGVTTDRNDPDKQYNNIFEDMHLPGKFMTYINNGMNFPAGWPQNQWNTFKKKVEGEYGFKSYYELVPITEYVKERDVAAVDRMKAPSATGSDFD